MYTLQEIAGYFSITQQSMLNYVKKHLDEINADGIHAAIKIGKWKFDDVAKMRLEKLRGFYDKSGVVVSQNPSVLEELRNEITLLSKKIDELEQKNSEGFFCQSVSRKNEISELCQKISEMEEKSLQKILLSQVCDENGKTLDNIFSEFFAEVEDFFTQLEKKQSQFLREQKSGFPTVWFWILFALQIVQFLYFFLR